MPLHTFLRSRTIAGVTLLVLVSGCGFQNVPSNPGLGASSGGGAAVLPAAPAAAPMAPAGGAPDLAAAREETRAPARYAVPRDARPGGALTLTVSGGDVLELTAPPAHGTAAISGSGGAGASVRYTQAPGYLGRDQFSISLAGGRRTVTVFVTTDAP